MSGVSEVSSVKGKLVELDPEKNTFKPLKSTWRWILSNGAG